MRPPLWLQWVLSIVVAAAVIFGLVRFVQSNTDNQITTESPAGEVQANREAEILVAEDQAPHTVRLLGHTPGIAAITRVIRADMTALIDRGSLNGPLQRSACAPTGSLHQGRAEVQLYRLGRRRQLPVRRRRRRQRPDNRLLQAGPSAGSIAERPAEPSVHGLASR